MAGLRRVLRSGALALAAALGLAGCNLTTQTSSQDEFNDWMAKDPARVSQFESFSSRLDDAEVGDVVPTWQLVRMDADYAARCGSELFAIPPKKLWDNMIPTLRLVRDKVVPVTGVVEVVSAWRPEDINACIGGASGSQHIQFAALDMVTVDDRPVRKLFADLCRMHDRAGSGSQMGFGAYFDPSFPARNTTGRFHIDSGGYRRWGYDYTRKSDPCPTLAGS